jgi:RNA polymerase sigma factor (sigma-70 family)
MDQADGRLPGVEFLDKLIWDETAAQLKERERHLVPQGCLAEVLRELSDESLALAIQKGFLRKVAFEELFVTRYTAYLARWFYRWRTDPVLALDLTQQLFVSFLTSGLASFRPTGSFRAYLWQAARNLRIDAVRRRKKLSSLDRVPERAGNGTSPEHEAEAHETEERVAAALQRLPEAQQVVLRETMKGRTADEIASELGLAKRCVFMRLFHARRQVEKELPSPAPASGGRIHVVTPRHPRPQSAGHHQGRSAHEQEPGQTAGRPGLLPGENRLGGTSYHQAPRRARRERRHPGSGRAAALAAAVEARPVVLPARHPAGAYPRRRHLRGAGPLAG